MTDVAERYSSSSKRSVVLAHEEARRLGHDHVGTEHLLLGILAEGENAAALALESVGVTLNGSRQKAEEAVGPSTRPRTEGDLPLTERARRSLDRAERLSLRQRSPEVEAEHILISVLQVEGRAGQVLRGLGVDPSRVRTALDGGPDPVAAAAVSAPPDVARATAGETAQADPPPGPAATTGALCANCGARLEQSLAHKGMASRGESGELRAFVVIYCSTCGSALGAANV